MRRQAKPIMRQTRCLPNNHIFLWTGGFCGRWALLEGITPRLVRRMTVGIDDECLIPGDPDIRCDCGQHTWAELYAVKEEA